MVDLPGCSLRKLPIDDGEEIECLVDKDVLCAEVHVVEGEEGFVAMGVLE